MTDTTLAGFNITALLVAIHWIPLLLSAWIWPLKKIRFSVPSAITLCLTVTAWLIVGTSVLLFFDVNPDGGQMTGFGAYLIYSFMSLGVVPLLIMAAHIFAGRSAGLWIRSLTGRRHAGPARQL
ncbi:MAG: hypothetical protein AAGI06_05290 [Pseudomonadota bacterium]